MPHVRVPIQRLDAELPAPAYAHPGDAGADLHSRQDLTLAPMHRALVPTGLAVAVPTGYVGLVHPRSGLAHRHGLTVLNAPGTVDSGYRGEIMVNLINLDPSTSVTVRRGDRIAQLLIQQVVAAEFVETDLGQSDRGAGGHGSTGSASFDRVGSGDPRAAPAADSGAQSGTLTADGKEQ